LQGNHKVTENFSVGVGEEGKKIAWISWENICKSKAEGGLAIEV